MPKSKSAKVFVILLCLLNLILGSTLGVMYARIRELEALVARMEQSAVSAEVPTLVNPVVASVTLSTAGDILPAQPILDACRDENGDYDFSPFFRYVTPYIQKANISAVNLVTTLAGQGTDYSGLPKYNTPDSIVETLKGTGFDAVLTANSHCYDAGLKGVKRTAETLRHAYMAPIGTTYDKEKPTWKVLEAKGIKIGLTCYAQESNDSYPKMPSLNGLLFDNESISFVDTFHPDTAEKFLAEAAERLQLMRQSGAEITVLYMNWGTEFARSPDVSQMSLAQSLCNLGFDVIIGSSTHTVQPMVELTSQSNADHKTLVCYSLGNFLSNQRRGFGIKSSSPEDAPTEDGLVLSLTFIKHADGSVYPHAVSALPCWVNLHSETQPDTYTILPLDGERRASWASDYGLSPEIAQKAAESYNRTMSVLNPALEEINSRLRDAAYRRAYGAAPAQNPD